MKTTNFLRKLFLVLLVSLIASGPNLAIEIKTISGQIYEGKNDGFLPTVGFDLAGESIEDSQGKLYIVDKNQHKIIIVDQTGYKTTFAGTGQSGSTNGKRLKASFKKPHGIVQDSLGNFYVSDTGNNLIRKIDTNGQVSTFAGSGNQGSSDGVAEEASFKTPMGLAIDSNDNLYVADQRNHLIRKIDTSGVVSTIAGTAGKSGLVDGLNSQFKYPESIAVDQLGLIYIADKANHVIRKLDSSGQVSTYAGTGNQGSADGAALSAEFNNPSDLAIDSLGNLYVADRSNHKIRKISPDGEVTSLLGSESGFWNESSSSYPNTYFNDPYSISINSNNELIINDLDNKKIRKINLVNESQNYQVDTIIGSGRHGFDDGKYYKAKIRSPISTAYDQNGNLYFTDSSNNLIRKLSANGEVTTIAGTGKKGFIDGGAPDSEIPAELNRPHSIVVNSLGEIFFSDQANHAIRKINSNGEVLTVSGTGSQGFKDGIAAEAKFNLPSGLAIDSSDNIYIADTNNHKIRKLSADGIVSTLSGTKPGYSSGNINFARFRSPSFLAIDSAANIYVSDKGNHKIRKISSTGLVSTIAGIGKGYQDGHGRYAQFNEPQGLALSPNGKTLYVADSKNNRIRIINLNNLKVKTLAGSGLAGYKDGNDSLVSFKKPHGLILSPSGALIVSDTDNHRIRKVSTNITPHSNTSKGSKKYFVSTISGNHQYDLVDGSARYSSYRYPHGIVKDSLGNLFIVDKANHVIRKIDTDGHTSVFAGTGLAGYADGDSIQAQFSNPTGIVIDADNNLYIADLGNHRIRKITADGLVSTIAGSGAKGYQDATALEAKFNKPYDLAIDSEGNIYISDSDNRRIRKLDLENNVTTVAGKGSSGFKDGYDLNAEFNSPRGIDIDSDNNLYIADFGNHRIRKIATDGLVSTIAGSGAASFKDGEAKFAQFNGPVSVLVNKKTIYVADYYNNKIRRISHSGNVTTLAGSGGIGAIDGLARESSFNSPHGLFMDKNSVLICDSKNNVIRKIYKTDEFAKEVLGFAYVSEEEPNETESGPTETNTRPVLKLATSLKYYSNERKGIATFTLGKDLELEVFSYDLEDQDTINSNITWESNYQGFLGQGSKYNIKELKLGRHHLTVKVKDSGNLSSTIEMDLRIIPFTAKPDKKQDNSNNSSGESSSNTNKTLLLKITTDENKLFKANKMSRFNVAAFDLRGSEPINLASQVKWSSSIDGDLGSGSEIKRKLSKGTHIITASIGEFKDTINIEVAGKVKRNKKKTKIIPKPKSLDQVNIPDINLESTQPKNELKKKGNNPGSNGNTVGVKDVKIKLL